MQNIRAGRENPGLRAQHLTGVVLVSMLPKSREFSSTLTDCRVGSTSFTFIPKDLEKKRLVLNCKSDSKEVHIDYDEDEEIKVSADCFTAGATTLMLQSSLCPLLFMDTNGKDIRMSYRGGTNVDFSPPIDEISNLLFPLLRRHFLKIDNSKSFDLQCKYRGFYPRGNGQAELFIEKSKYFKKGEFLHAVELVERGDSIVKLVLEMSYTDNDGLDFLEKVEQALKVEINKNSSFLQPFSKKLEIQVEKKKCNNNPSKARAVFGTCIMYDSKENAFGASFHTKDMKKSQKFKVDEHITHTKSILKHLAKQWNEGGCVDEYVQDQLIIFMTLAKGKSKIRTGPLTLHTQTAIHFCQTIAGVQFTVTPQEGNSFIIECEGLGQSFE